MKARPLIPTIKSYTYKLLFGKYKGRTIEFVIGVEPGYILWMHDEKLAIFDSKILDTAEEADIYQRLSDAIDAQDFGVDMWDYMSD